MDDRRDDATAQPFLLKPSDEPWRPAQGRLTRAIAWLVLIVMLLGALAAALMKF